MEPQSLGMQLEALWEKKRVSLYSEHQMVIVLD
jgi:hypothetical protein